MIYFLPLEPLEQRYTKHMHDLVLEAIAERGLPVQTVYGEQSYERIQHGQWLDTVKSCKWKTDQIVTMNRLIAEGELKSGDIILFGDVWHPGAETLRFQTELLGLNVKFAGWHYAGVFDPHDYLHHGLGVWSRAFETALFNGIFDHVAFGSASHLEMLARSCCLGETQCYVTGLAWNDQHLTSRQVSPRDLKSPTVAFTHRWCAEKRVAEWLYLADRFKGVRFAFSTNGEVSGSVQRQCKQAGVEIVQHASKEDYYRWLSTIDIVWSGADQETFGYSFMEAVALRRLVVAPNRLSYRDHFTRAGLDPDLWLYPNTDIAGADMLERALAGNVGAIPSIVSSQYNNSVGEFLRHIHAR